MKVGTASFAIAALIISGTAPLQARILSEDSPDTHRCPGAFQGDWRASHVQHTRISFLSLSCGRLTTISSLSEETNEYDRWDVAYEVATDGIKVTYQGTGSSAVSGGPPSVLPYKAIVSPITIDPHTAVFRLLAACPPDGLPPPETDMLLTENVGSAPRCLARIRSTPSPSE